MWGPQMAQRKALQIPAFQKTMTLENIVKKIHYLHLKQTSNGFTFQIFFVGWIVLVPGVSGL